MEDNSTRSLAFPTHGAAAQLGDTLTALGHDACVTSDSKGRPVLLTSAPTWLLDELLLG